MRINEQTQLPDQERESEVQHSSDELDVSVVIPCLNEANSLAFCVEKALTAIRSAGLNGEVIVADNGSTDGSVEIAEHNGATVIRVPERGYGAALNAGIGARLSEIPIILWPDKRGRPPHLRSFRDGWRSLRFMLLYAPNWLYLVPGGLLLACGLALIFWLLPGPRPLTSRVTLDVHTMVFGVIFTLLGAQILSIGAFAKVFSYAARFDRGTISLKRLLKRITLETGLLVGGIIFLSGFAGCAWLTWKWVDGGFGPLYAIRQVLFWSTCLFLAF